jgi:hypothetical protein
MAVGARLAGKGNVLCMLGMLSVGSNDRRLRERRSSPRGTPRTSFVTCTELANPCYLFSTVIYTLI